jgi:uroporphyrin-III C-methyltransferase / precorrin-2 dehydrogenase / sirohydrochlorin ferrochelatase
MPKRTLAELTEVAMVHGLDPNAPAIAVANATRPDERVIIATVGTVAAALDSAHPEGPVLVMIGEALRYATPSEALSHADSVAHMLDALPEQT